MVLNIKVDGQDHRFIGVKKLEVQGHKVYIVISKEFVKKLIKFIDARRLSVNVQGLKEYDVSYLEEEAIVTLTTNPDVIYKT